MPSEDKPDLSLFFDILRTLERIGAPYMIIGGFAATMYGITRTTLLTANAGRRPTSAH